MLLFCVLLGFLIGVAKCEYTNDYESENAFYPPETWSDTFDWKVLRLLSDQSVNVLYSPITLKLVLGILYEASSGATQRNMENSLHFLSKNNSRENINRTIASLYVSPDSGNQLNLSTRIFLDSNIKPKESYSNRINEYYNADIESTNFTDIQESSKKVNEWAEQTTMGAITRLIEPDDLKDMRMLLVNTIYFKGLWNHPFPKNETSESGFYINPNITIRTDFMTTTDMFYYFESHGMQARILRMPYKNSNFSMFFILPYSKAGLPDLMANLNLVTLHQQLYFLDRRPVLVSLPKFAFKLKASFKDILQEIGLKKMFQNSASFTGLVEGNSSILRELVVSDILQSSGIEVDEKGSTAFAATNVIIGNKIGIHENIFNASHPFLFFIQNDVTGTILFLGKVSNPQHLKLEIQKRFDDIEEEFPSFNQSS